MPKPLPTCCLQSHSAPSAVWQCWLRLLRLCLSCNALQACLWPALLPLKDVVHDQGKAHGETEVLSCLISNYNTVDEGCQREVSRAVRMALWNYQPQLALTGMACLLTVQYIACKHIRGHVQVAADRHLEECGSAYGRYLDCSHINNTLSGLTSAHVCDVHTAILRL